MTPAELKEIALGCGFELAGIAAAQPLPDAVRYQQWARRGMAGSMGYLSDRRAALRNDPRTLLPSARSILCVGKLYNTAQPYSTALQDRERAWISRYAWGDDYHAILRAGLRRVVEALRARGLEFEWKICVDTAPLLERSYARLAGLGWIGKNTCLIHQGKGSWFFLGELLLSLPLEPDQPPPDRCGTCRRCIDACPTAAIVPTGEAEPAWELDARLCISYLTIERREPAAETLREGVGNHVFGCDICQDVCPWNRRAATGSDPAFAPRQVAPPLDQLSELTEQDFLEMFRQSPVLRARYAGFLRNVIIAMANSAAPRFRPHLERLSRHPDDSLAALARWALTRIGEPPPAQCAPRGAPDTASPGN